MAHQAIHKFHIPVMGLAFTIDSPIKVARFGINSVISIVEDNLIEIMRQHYYQIINRRYHAIDQNDPDCRAKRITDYLNLVNAIVQSQVEKIKKSVFEKGSEIVQYFEMLPEDSKIKKLYLQMLSAGDDEKRARVASYLKTQIVPGSIYVNVMTKTDKNNFDKNVENGSDAIAAVRGYVKSNLKNSSIVFSAGMNPRLYNCLEKCNEFNPDEKGVFDKKIIIQVSDYHSALIQGKYLAKKGIWVSEFRIESGLNCGGHAFATNGFLLGPILEEFKKRKQELIDTLVEIYSAAIENKKGKPFVTPPVLLISAQGGIGTAEEDQFLHEYYGVDSTGWGLPFLLVPEATTADENTLVLLRKAKRKDVTLGNNSPVGVRFQYLKGSSGEAERINRINIKKPGSPCTEKHSAFNTEFTKEPVCKASTKYQQLKISQLKLLPLAENEYQQQLSDILDKECLCIGFSNSAAINYDQVLVKNLHAVTICPGPNIAYFNKIVSLQTMLDHIYGRSNIIDDLRRPNMFITELNLYIDFLQEELEQENHAGVDKKKQKYFLEFFTNLKEGIIYYKKLMPFFESQTSRFLLALFIAECKLTSLIKMFPACVPDPIMIVP